MSLRPPSALSQAVYAHAERRKRGVEAHCLCQRPPSTLSQAIVAEVERRKRGVKAQCFSQRSPSAFFDVIPSEIQFDQGCRQEACNGLRQADSSRPPQLATYEAQHSHLAII